MKRRPIIRRLFGHRNYRKNPALLDSLPGIEVFYKMK